MRQHKNTEDEILKYDRNKQTKAKWNSPLKKTREIDRWYTHVASWHEVTLTSTRIWTERRLSSIQSTMAQHQQLIEHQFLLIIPCNGNEFVFEFDGTSSQL
jgi:hypothetical protein